MVFIMIVYYVGLNIIIILLYMTCATANDPGKST